MGDGFSVKGNESVQEFFESNFLILSRFRVRNSEWIVFSFWKGEDSVDCFTFILASFSLLYAILLHSLVEYFERFERHSVILLDLNAEGEERFDGSVNMGGHLKGGILLFLRLCFALDFPFCFNGVFSYCGRYCLTIAFAF